MVHVHVNVQTYNSVIYRYAKCDKRQMIQDNTTLLVAIDWPIRFKFVWIKTYYTQVHTNEFFAVHSTGACIHVCGSKHFKTMKNVERQHHQACNLELTKKLEEIPVFARLSKVLSSSQWYKCKVDNKRISGTKEKLHASIRNFCEKHMPRYFCWLASCKPYKFPNSDRTRKSTDAFFEFPICVVPKTGRAR